MLIAVTFSTPSDSPNSRQRDELVSNLGDFPYLWMSLALFSIFVVLYLARPEVRRPMLLSAILSAPYALASLAFVPRYWAPVRIMEWGAGPEDLIFSFANGGLVWFTSGFFISHTGPADLDATALVRYLKVTLTGIGLSFVWCLLSREVMSALLITTFILLIFLIRRRPRLWPAAVRGGVFFAAFYYLVLKTVFLFWPHFGDQWNPAAQSGLFLLGVPLKEMLWAFGYGSFWPLFMHFVMLDRPSGGPSPNLSGAGSTTPRRDPLAPPR